VDGEWDRIHCINNAAKASIDGCKMKLSIELYRLESKYDKLVCLISYV
jgi:hypothetical protein